jgi:putative flippase GtrA
MSSARDPARVLRFGFVGGVGFLTDAGCLAALLTAGAAPVPARLGSIAMALLVTWLLNRRLAFRSPLPPSLGEFSRYAAVGATSSAINFAVYSALLLTTASVTPLMATAAGSAVAMTVTFLGLERFVFGRAALRRAARRPGPRSSPR